jgi:LysM repeat protein
MNRPNPLVPQGSLQEQSKRKSQIRIIVFSILAIHVVLLGALLIQGCKREEAPPPPKMDLPPPMPVADTNPPPVPPPATNPPPTAYVPPAPQTNITDFVPGAAKEHVIAKGETFAVLAKKYGVSPTAIQQANPGVDPTKLKIGQKITIPPKPPAKPTGSSSSSLRTPEPEVAAGETLYSVKKGDNLYNISKANGVSVKAIRTANNLKTDQLKPGQKLKLPVRGTTPAAAAPAAAASAPAAPGPATMPTPMAAVTSAPLSSPSAP